MFTPKLKKELNKSYLSERHINIDKLSLLIKQDIFSVLYSYFDIKPSDMVLRLEINDNCEYELKCKIKTKRVKIVGFVK